MEKYSAEDIKVLEFPEAIRCRPGMYMGGANHEAFDGMIVSVVAEAVEAAGRDGLVNITFRKDGSVCVQDNGPGLPDEVVSDSGRREFEHYFTRPPHRPCIDWQKYRRDPKGFGLSIITALSEWLHVVLWKEDCIYDFRFSQGVMQGEPRRINDTTSIRSGLRLDFKPDPTIFLGIATDVRRIRGSLQELAALYAGTIVCVVDEAGGTTERFQ